MTVSCAACRYQDMDHEKFGSLRVINEDRVAAKKGFGTHPHREFEIWSYVVDGTLEQYVTFYLSCAPPRASEPPQKTKTLILLLPVCNSKDSMGNTEILRRGDIQLTSAGTGIAHSEHAAPASNAPVHILQIWAVPAQRGLPPTYYTRHFGDAQKTNKWVRLVAPVGEAGVLDAREGGGPVPVHSGVRMWGSILEQGKKPGVEGEGGEGGVPLKGAKAYVHVVQTSGYNPGKAEGAQVKVTGGGEELVMREGDGVYVWTEGPGRLIVENTGDRKAEVLVFDLD